MTYLSGPILLAHSPQLLCRWNVYSGPLHIGLHLNQYFCKTRKCFHVVALSAFPSHDTLNMLYKIRAFHGKCGAVCVISLKGAIHITVLSFLFLLFQWDKDLMGTCILMAAKREQNIVTVCLHAFIIICIFQSAASPAEECFRTSVPFTYEVVPLHFLQLSRQRLSVRGN